MIDPPLFERALIVEDLDEPRIWLAQLLPKAMPSVQRVDTAETLAQARACMRGHGYGLALVDWGLPDGTSEELIAELVAASEGAVVIVATIYDDDTHVFPALRAGASGYILKSQPDAVVIAQLQRIERGEPALSPSIAMRLLRHFRALPAQASASPPELLGGVLPNMADETPLVKLTDREADVLRLIAKGYRSPEVAPLLGLTPATVSSYVRDIYRKLGISSRAEAAMEAVRRGLVA
jgi:DNA-binding NarL/FixJ family response regulator